jgi:uncharacterized protein (DUF1778 family)
MGTTTDAKPETLDIRIKVEVRNLIDRAANARGKNGADSSWNRRVPLRKMRFLTR